MKWLIVPALALSGCYLDDLHPDVYEHHNHVVASVPAPIAENPGYPPEPGSVWHPGHWVMNHDGGYVWEPGFWEHAH